MPGRPLTRASQQIIESLTTTPEWWEGTLDKIACGDSPKAVADEYCILFGVFMRWIEANADRRREYDAALRIATEGHAHDCIAIADEQKEAVGPGGKVYDPDVARDKLRIETRLKLAGKWDRARYGETVKHEHSATLVAVDAGLLGVAADLLGKISGGTRKREIDVSPDQSMDAVGSSARSERGHEPMSLVQIQPRNLEGVLDAAQAVRQSTRVIDVSPGGDGVDAPLAHQAVESPHLIAATPDDPGSLGTPPPVPATALAATHAPAEAV